jgi:hypothetical protein
MGNEIIATALEQLAYVLREHPLQEKVAIKTLIGRDGGMAPEITIEFSVQRDAKGVKPVEVEMTLWQGSSNQEACILIFSAFSTETGDGVLEDGLLQETIYLKHLDDAYPYFEKALDLFSQEETE